MPRTWRRRYGAYIRRGDSVGGSGWRSAGVSWQCRSTRPGCEQGACWLGASLSAAPRTSWCSSVPGLAWRGCATFWSPFDLQLPQLDIQIPYLVVFEGGVEGTVAEAVDVAQVQCIEPVGPWVVVHVAAVVEEG